MSTEEVERAWQYHDAADKLLNDRIQSFLIAQAFLIVGYAQILTSSAFLERLDLQFMLVAVSILAISLTILMKFLAAQLSRGIRKLKENYLLHSEIGDEVYKTYFSAVKGEKNSSTLDGFARGWTKTLPMSFLAFWFLASLYAVFVFAESMLT